MSPMPRGFYTIPNAKPYAPCSRLVLELLPHTRPIRLHSCTAGLLADQIAKKLGEFACPYGCGATHSYAGWPAHTLVCPNTPMECPFWHTADKCKSRKCNFSGTLAELNTHVNDQTHCKVVYFADCMETTIHIKTFMEAVTDACSVPANHPYYHDIVQNRNYNRAHSRLLPMPATMRVIDGELQTWQLSEVYGMIYGYKMYIGGLLITFFTTVKNGDSVSLHYIAWSLTAETLTFDIIMSNEKKRRVNNSTVIESMLKVSPRMVSHSHSPLSLMAAGVRGCAGGPLRSRQAHQSRLLPRCRKN